MPKRAKNLPFAVASDHAGFPLKAYLMGVLKNWGETIADLGTDGVDSVDYPDFAGKVAQGIQEKRYWAGLLICGSGIGMSIAANRFVGVRAAVCTSAYTAEVARRHNDANILCLGGRVIGIGEAESILRAFLDHSFDGGRHRRRVSKLDSKG
jgi:ribose 5-phosphate isomerase B